jgi:hypothetical protein
MISSTSHSAPSPGLGLDRSRGRLAAVRSHMLISAAQAAADAPVSSEHLLLVEPPAAIGDAEVDVETPSLIVDLVYDPPRHPTMPSPAPTEATCI